MATGGVTITVSFAAPMTEAERQIVAAALAQLIALKDGQITYSFSGDSDPEQTYQLGKLTFAEIERVLTALGVPV